MPELNQAVVRLNELIKAAECAVLANHTLVCQIAQAPEISPGTLGHASKTWMEALGYLEGLRDALATVEGLRGAGSDKAP